MNFNRHLNLEGKHAFLSASKYSWLRYSDAKLSEAYRNHLATARGTALHQYACDSIRLKRWQPDEQETLCMYINDALRYNMDPEVVLFYSEFCYGTCDAIGIEDGYLRIHDLKTGVRPAGMDQLKIYAALFCLEYDVIPGDIEIELRIYQNSDIQALNPTNDEIAHVVDRIVTADRILRQLRSEEPEWMSEFM